MDLGEHAIEAACAGHWVFPLRPRAKTPATPNGFHDATDDIGRIWSWWHRHPDHNIGIATGASRLVVIDLDVTNDDDGHCGEAFAAMCALASEHGDLPATFEVSTPRGGEHWYYTVPAGVEMPRNSAGKLAPHVDVRADGGYVVGVGSVLDRGGYRAETDRDIAEVPPWLLAVTAYPTPLPYGTAGAERAPRAGLPRSPGSDTPPTRGGDDVGWKRFTAACGRVAMAPEGQRNATLFWAAALADDLIVEYGLAVHAVVDELILAGRRAGLDEREINNTICSGLNRRGDA